MAGRFGGFVLAAGLVLCGGGAMAQTHDIAGVYDFASTARGTDGAPVCAERWTLRADGGFLIESGQERVSGAWTLEEDKTGQLWLMQTGQTSNGQPDCTGHKASAPLTDNRSAFYFNVDANLMLAPPTAHNPDGSLLYQRPYAVLRKSASKP